jgi:predicted 3-demethylubiquinone-9 3-methyltransferase (glyoxalase superfamily)
MSTLQSEQRVIPCLWFDDQAEEAVEFYTAIFGNSKITNTNRYGEAAQDIPGKSPESVMTVEFELHGQVFTSLNGGPNVTLNPSISLTVAFETKEKIDRMWEKLADGGTEMMPLQEYPFSERFGWVQDKFGLSWQLNFVGEGNVEQRITPSFMFVGEQAGQAEDAMNFYASIFPNAAINHIQRWEAGQEPEREGTVSSAQFGLDGEQFTAMDSKREHQFTFNQALSLQVMCEDQDEVDHFWDKLSEGGDGDAQQCGWLKDKYGVSWQVVPRAWIEMAKDPDPAKSRRVFEAMFQMKKLDIAELKRAYDNSDDKPHKEDA